MIISNRAYHRIYNLTITLFFIYILWLAIPTVSTWVVEANKMTKSDIIHQLHSVFVVVACFLALTSAIYSVITGLVGKYVSFFTFFHGQLVGIPAIVIACVTYSHLVYTALAVVGLILLIANYGNRRYQSIQQQAERRKIAKSIEMSRDQ